MGEKLSGLGLIMSFPPYLSSAMVRFPFSFQTLKFVTNIKSDNSIMCIWFKTAYYSDGQHKHLTAEGELFDSHDSPYAVIFVVVAHLYII